MNISTEQKKRVLKECEIQLKNFGGQNKMAKAFGIATAQMSRILNGEIDGVLSDEGYLKLANELSIDLRGYNWQTAKTPTFNKIYAQLSACQKDGISAMLIDNAGVGKSHTAKVYCKENPNAAYVDCSQVKTKLLFIKEISRKFGLGDTGKYADIYKRLVFYLYTSKNPLVILDEAGDLKGDAFLELKAIWNATEGVTGFYMMGADGLRAKIERKIQNKTVGYTEIFRRFGERFQQATPFGKEELERFQKQQLSLVAKANKMKNVQELYAKTNGSLTRLKIEFLKNKRRLSNN